MFSVSKLFSLQKAGKSMQLVVQYCNTRGRPYVTRNSGNKTENHNLWSFKH